MKARILFLSDLHKRDCDFSTIAGYTKAVDAVQQDILDFIDKYKVTHVISLGDWYDKGYRSINRSNHDRNWDEAISRAVQGNFYICLGNHFFLERDNNPEMYLIQPNQEYIPSQPIYATSPVIQVVNSLRIRGVQISFFHFSKNKKIYMASRDPDTIFHLGIYHDETVVPTAYRNKAGFPGVTSTAHLDTIFSNIDMAIVGHVHTPLGVFNVQTMGREVPMIVPGSLAITATGAQNIHTEVKLPIIDISDENTVKCSLSTFSLHANLLKFYERKTKQKALAKEGDVLANPFDLPKTLSLPEYLRAHGHSENNIRLADAVSESVIDIKQGLSLLGLLEGENNDTAGT